MTKSRASSHNFCERSESSALFRSSRLSSSITTLYLFRMRLPLAADFLCFPVATFGSSSSGSGCHSFCTSSPNDMPALLALLAPHFRLAFFPRVFMRSSHDTQLTVARIEYVHRSPSLASPFAHRNQSRPHAFIPHQRRKSASLAAPLPAQDSVTS